MNSTTLEKLVGSCVEKIERSQSGALLLTFCNPPEVLSLPEPWSFTSCLTSLSSDELSNDSEVSADLIGLEGAEFSAFKWEGKQADLVFGSITISTTLHEPEAKPDLSNRDDIVRLVDRFYEKVNADTDLSPVFNDVAKIDWESHLPKMYDFWDTVLFRAGTFRGDPVGAHARLVAHTDMSMARFEHWLTLFRSAVHELYAGENATHIIRCAEDMANVLYSKVNRVPDPRFTK